MRVGRYFLSLFLILAALYSIVIFSSQSNAPKLGLDLEGGAQIVFKAVTDNGQAPSKDSMRVAKEILTTRVNGAGVSSPEVVQEGSDRIVVSVPGKSVRDIASIGAAAQLNFRPIVVAPIPANPTPVPSASATASGTPAPSGSGTATPSGSTSGTSRPSTGATSSGAQARPTGSASGSGSGTAGSASGSDANNLAAAPSSSSGSAPVSGSPSSPASGTPTSPATGASGASPSPSGSAASSGAAIDPLAGLNFAVPKNGDEFSALSAANKSALAAKLSAYKCNQKVIDDRNKPLIACSEAGGPTQQKYLLGPVIVPGKEIDTASAIAPNPGQQGGSSVWTVALDLKSTGQRAWAEYTGKYHQDTSATGGNQGSATCVPDFTGQSTQAGGLPCAQYVAFTLDGKVISDPHNEATINGTTSITGNFNETSATELANQLKFGALPLSFDTQTTSDVSATLGTGQLKAGLLAGGIGLVLVVLYSLLYYRGLGFVTIASLLVSGALTYALLVILGREIGFTLTLAGIAGFIVAVGITADSFVVYFERIKDEVHDGRSFATAVPRAWARARRTIISADVVSLLAAVILYALSAGEVRGFAFTLGLSTLLDLVIVFLFTHPLVALLARSRAFGSPRFTGLNAVRTRPAVAAEQERLEVASGMAPTSARRSRRGGTALLEREPDTAVDTGDDDDEILDLTGPADAEPAPAATDPEPDAADDHKASASTAAARRRARAERTAVVDTDMSAAERAAARRGRTARPPREAVVEPEANDELDDTSGDDDIDDSNDVDADTVTTETDTVEDTPARSRRGLRRRGRSASPGLAEIPEPALQPADEVVPIDEDTDDRPVVDVSTHDVDESDADEDHASEVDLDPTAPPQADSDPAAAVDTSPASDPSDTPAVDASTASPARSPRSTAKPASSAAKPAGSAAERAAARRARLRAKSSDTEGDAS